MTRPSTRNLRARSVLAGEAPATAVELDAALEIPPVSRTAACWLVTATPVEPARLLARRPGPTGALERVAAERDGVYTGELQAGCASTRKWPAGAYVTPTERKAARLGLLTAGGSGVTLGTVSAAMAIRKRVS